VDLYSALVSFRSLPVLGTIAYYLLKILGVEIPRSVQVGERFTLVHGGFGVVIHPSTVIGSGVKVYPGVTIGRADIHRSASESGFERVEIGDDVILSPGSKVLGGAGVLQVSTGTVLGANAVLLQSTGINEIWAGVPATRKGLRDGG
jgi:serine O-acetyltransferase